MNPFTGDLVASVDRYSDIPAPVRARLKQRMATRQYDELVDIRRDAIVGRDQYAPQIREMHFGGGRVCRTVTRAHWAKDSQERGLVYCDSGQCLLVPTVCRNLSRITRLHTGPGTAGLPPAAGGSNGQSAGGSPSTFAGAAAPLGDGWTGAARSRGLQVPEDAVSGAGLVAPPPASPVEPVGSPSYPTVQGPVGSVTFYPGPVVPAPAPAVPEPASLLLWLVGGTGLLALRRRRRVIP